MPKFPLEGQLFTDKRSDIRAVLTNIGESEGWGSLKFQIVDAPTQYHLNIEEKVEMLKALITPDNDQLVYHCILCQNQDHLKSAISRANANQSHAIFLKRANSYYLATSSFFEIPINKPKVILSAKQSSVKNLEKEKPAKREHRKEGTSIYSLCLGRSSARLPKCRGCQRSLPKEEIRINVKGTFRPPKCGPMPVEYYFCINKECLDKGYVEDSTNSQISYFPFAGVVRVPLDFKSTAEKQVEGITWVLEDEPVNEAVL